MISFIIPTLPNEPCLSNTLKSIIKEIEGYKRKDKFEVLVMVEKEEDTFPELLNELKKDYNYINCYFTQGNRSNAKNKGYKLAKNNILTFVDADTEIEDNFIKYTLEDFKKGYGYVNYSARPRIREMKDKPKFYFYSQMMNFIQYFLTISELPLPNSLHS